MAKPTVAISINSSWNFVNFRAGLLRALVEKGYRVLAIAPEDAFTAQLIAMGVEHVPLPMDPHSLSPLQGLGLTAHYLRILRRYRPGVYLGYTPKPNVFGSLAAHLLGIPVINNIAGLGRAFANRGLVSSVVGRLYRVSLARSKVVFFQNSNDQAFFTNSGYVRESQARLLPGSGVDVTRFAPVPRSEAERDGFVFVLISRLLKAKGISDYVEAARIVRADDPAIRFQLVGIEQSGADAVSASDLTAWHDEGVIERYPATNDVREYLAGADCVVLPTQYPEGTPRVLLEAAAMARPAIASDVPGCRDIIVDGVTGYLCQPRDVQSLIVAIRKLLALPKGDLAEMGRSARTRAETNYDEVIVITAYLRAIEEALGGSTPPRAAS